MRWLRLSGSGGEQAGQRHWGGRWHALGAGHLHGTCPVQHSSAAFGRRTAGRAGASTECACSEAGCLQQHTLEAPLVRPISSAITCAAAKTGCKEVCIAWLGAGIHKPCGPDQRAVPQLLRSGINSSATSCTAAIWAKLLWRSEAAPPTRSPLQLCCCPVRAGSSAATHIHMHSHELAPKHPPPARCHICTPSLVIHLLLCLNHYAPQPLAPSTHLQHGAAAHDVRGVVAVRGDDRVLMGTRSITAGC